MARKKIYAVCIGIIIGFTLLSAIIFFGIDYFVTKNEIHAYLSENYSRLEITPDGDVFGNVTDSGYEIYLAGETHGTEKNYLAQLSLIKMFNKDAGVTRILLELPHSVCVKLNEFLSSGDTVILDEIFSSVPERSHVKNTANRDFFVSLKAYNDNLPDDKKLKLIGLDLEFSDKSIKNAICVLQEIISKVSDAPEVLKESWNELAEIDTGASYSNETLSSVFGRLLRDAVSEKGALSSALKKDLTDYVCIVQSVNETINLNLSNHSDAQKAQLRESLMYRIFQTVYSANGQDKFFGQFGVEHIYLSRRNYTNVADSLAKQINETEAFAGKVCSIRYSYKNGKYLDFNKNQIRHIGQTMYETEFNNFPPSDSSLTLFKIDGKDSIFKRQQIIVNGRGKCTADYFQYVLLIENSPTCQKAVG